MQIYEKQIKIYSSGSGHQKQNREGSKAQNGQYTACWAGLLHLVLEPRTTRLKVRNRTIYNMLGRVVTHIQLILNL
jgi:hypothetical protein